MALHTGEASERAGDYLGPAVNRAARLMATAQGGQILTSSATSALIDDYDLRPLGEHWLKDLGTPDRISQVLADGLEAEFAPIHGLHVVPNNLPVIDDALIGRETDSETVADLLAKHQLVTIVGVGGIGKTRLALDVAASCIDSFNDGVWYCELASAGSSEAVAQSVADVLGIKQHPGRSLLDSMAQVLHDKTLLLVLDNCEHVLEPTSDLAETLDNASPDVRILATSREPLIVVSAQVYPLPSLDTNGPDSPASQLFIERARQARPGLDPSDPHTRQLIGEICARLDGIPLAIELAAARTRSLTLTDLDQRLGDMLHLLRGGRTRIERHQTLQAAIDWSYQQLSPEEQRLFGRLSVFVGGFTLDACESVCDLESAPEEILDQLDILVTKSFVQFDDTATDSRYRALEPLRQYGASKLIQAGEAAICHDRHLTYYTSLVEDIGQQAETSEEPRGLTRLWLDYPNIRVAHAHAVATTAVDPAVRIPVSLNLIRYCTMRYEIGDWAGKAFELEGVREHPDLPDLIHCLATNTADRGDFERFDELAAIAADLTPPGRQPIPLAVIQGLRLVFSGEHAAAVDVMLNVVQGPVPYRDVAKRAVGLCQYQKYTDPDAAAENAAHALQSVDAPSRRAMLHGLRAVSLALAQRADEGRTDAAAAVQLLELVPGNYGRNYPALGEAAVYATLNTATPEVLQRAHAALVRWRDTGNRAQVWEHLHWLPLLLDAAGATEHAAALAHINIEANRPILTTAPSYAPIREQLTALAQLDPYERTGEQIAALGATNYAIAAFNDLM